MFCRSVTWKWDDAWLLYDSQQHYMGSHKMSHASESHNKHTWLEMQKFPWWNRVLEGMEGSELCSTPVNKNFILLQNIMFCGVMHLVLGCWSTSQILWRMFGTPCICSDKTCKFGSKKIEIIGRGIYNFIHAQTEVLLSEINIVCIKDKLTANWV